MTRCTARVSARCHGGRTSIRAEWIDIHLEIETLGNLIARLG